MKKVLSVTGGGPKAGGLKAAGKVFKEMRDKPDIMIGQSSGALTIPILAASYEYPEVLDKALEMAGTLEMRDIFPFAGNRPFTEEGDVPLNAYFRAATGHNHLGWQDIRPLYKKLFKKKHLKALQRSSIECIAFGVIGKNGMPEMKVMNRAKTVDELIDMIEETARIVPFVQHANGRIDGGFVAFSPGVWLLMQNPEQISEYTAIYADPVKTGVGTNENWDKNIITVTGQIMGITTNYIAYYGAVIEELLCKQHNINYTRVECPDGYLKLMYDTDDKRLQAFAQASREAAIERLTNNDTPSLL